MTHTQDTTPANPIPPGWPDPLESPQAEAIRNGKLDDTEISNLFDCMERELRLHRERAANPAQGVSGLLLKAAEMAERSAALNEVYQAREEYLRFAQDCRAAIGAGGQAVAEEALEWSDAALEREYGWLIVAIAETPFGQYTVEKNDEGIFRVCLTGQVVNGLARENKDDAQAAAQADYERRILSSIAHPVQPGWRELREAFEAARYVPGDHPVVPVKIDKFMKTVERLLSAAPKGE